MVRRSHCDLQSKGSDGEDRCVTELEVMLGGNSVPNAAWGKERKGSMEKATREMRFFVVVVVFFFFKIFVFSIIVDLQCSVNFWCTQRVPVIDG